MARLMLLPEDDLLLRAVLGAPGADPPLQRTPDAGIQVRVPAHHLLEHADWADARTVLQDRHHLGLEDICQGVRPSAAPEASSSGTGGTDRGQHGIPWRG